MLDLLQAAVLTPMIDAATLLPIERLDPAPDDEDVKAGWTALVIFLLLIGALVVLSFSLTKQLRKAQTAKDSGVYGDEPAEGGSDESAGGAAPRP